MTISLGWLRALATALASVRPGAPDPSTGRNSEDAETLYPQKRLSIYFVRARVQ